MARVSASNSFTWFRFNSQLYFLMGKTEITILDHLGFQNISNFPVLVMALLEGSAKVALPPGIFIHSVCVTGDSTGKKIVQRTIQCAPCFFDTQVQALTSFHFYASVNISSKCHNYITMVYV